MNLHPLYLLACVVVGIAGRRRRAGFLGFAVIAMALTPLVALLILVAAGPRPAPQAEQDE
jgi:hypothetical protein